jgi:trehalose/maltose hydrolase-like predicted phosphorylase
MSKTSGWCIEKNQFDAQNQHHEETVFTISNGYLGTRGVYEEGYPDEERSTFVHGVFDDIPIVFTELANIPDWLELVINLDGERFDLATGQVLFYERSLDLRTATLHREVRWRSPAGRTSRLVFDRFASLADPHLVGIKVEITAENYNGTLEIQSGIDINADNLGFKHWKWIDQAFVRHQAWLKCQTITSGVELVMGISMRVTSEWAPTRRQWNVKGHPTLVARTAVGQGKKVSVQKWALIYTTRDDPNPLLLVKRRLHSLERTSISLANRMGPL